MNALDIQHLLVVEHNKLAGMPLTESTLLTFKENLKNYVRSYISTFDIHLIPLEEWEQHHLLASSSALKHIFYCLCLSWVPHITVLSDENGHIVKTTITKDDLLSNEASLVVLGLIALFIKDGELYVVSADSLQKHLDNQTGYDNI